MLPNFSADELRCQGTGLIKFAPGFPQAVQGLRDALTLDYVMGGMSFAEANSRAAMRLNSVNRAKEHNDRPRDEGGAGGHPRSLHVSDFPHHDTGGCCAIDVFCPVETHADYRKRLERIAWARGWSIGYHARFLHLDLRTQYAGLKQSTFNY